MHKLIKLKKFNDSRGGLTKFFTNSTLIENNFGSVAESYIITFNCVNVVRGEHFHKNTNEIFSVIKGKCRFEVIENNKIIQIDVDEDKKKALLVVSNTPHRIISLVDESIVIAISSREYFEDDTDTYDYIF